MKCEEAEEDNCENLFLALFLHHRVSSMARKEMKVKKEEAKRRVRAEE